MTTEVITFYVVYIDHDVTYSNYHARNIIFLFKKRRLHSISFYLLNIFKKGKKLYLRWLSSDNECLNIRFKKRSCQNPEQSANIRILCSFLKFNKFAFLHLHLLEIISSRFQISTIKSSLQDVSLIFFFCTTRLILIWQEIGYVYMSSCD